MLSNSSSYPCPRPRTFFVSLHSRKHNLVRNTPFSFRKPNTPSISSLRIGVEQIAEIAQNKVLIAASISGAIGQLLKPFTSALLYGNNVDFKAAVRSGGFPSTHSAGVVAAATSLALERGFSDSFFGMAVVFAGLVMYDAQGVRREVGNHAKLLNTKLLGTQETPISYRDSDKNNLIDSNTASPYVNSESRAPLLSLSEKGSSCISDPTETSVLTRSENRTSGSSSMPSLSLTVEKGKVINSSIQLKESIGHTELEVVGGALLGFLVSLAVHSLM